MNKLTSNTFRKNATYGLFVLPVFIPFIIFFIVPFFMGTYYSFFEWDGVSSVKKFIGLDNYKFLFTEDKNYKTTILFTFKYVIMNVILTNVFALLMAMLLDTKIKSKTLLRAAFFLPNVISAIVVGFVWIFIYGSVSTNLFDMTGWNVFNTSWLGDPKIAVFSMVIVAIWQGMGYIMVIYIAGLQTIDTSYVEASSIDGATVFQKFRYITLPLLMPSITVNLFMTTSQSFRLFDLNISLTGGGPGNATMSMALDIYKEAFQNGKIGYGASKATILFIIVLIITIFQIKYTKGKEVEA